MSLNIGGAVGNFLGFDPTPGFNIGKTNSALGTRPTISGTPTQHYGAVQTGGNPLAGFSSSNPLGGTQIAGGVASSADQSGAAGTGSYPDGTAGAAAQQAGDVAFLDDQEAQLRDLLGRLGTNQSQGLTRLGNDYQSAVNDQNSQLVQAQSDNNAQRVSTEQDKLKGQDRARSDANTGYRSLAQLIGRASGTGSSIFQDVLPNAVGKDLSGNEKQLNETAGQNFQRIDRGDQETKLSFDRILEDLARQRQAGEQNLLTGIEGQRQTLQGQLGTVAGQRAQAAGGGYAEVKAAQAPNQQAIVNSRNAVENFFNQYNPGIQAGAATISTPELSKYTVNRADVNAQQSGEAGNPYSQILRRKLQDQSA